MIPNSRDYIIVIVHFKYTYFTILGERVLFNLNKTKESIKITTTTITTATTTTT